MLFIKEKVSITLDDKILKEVNAVVDGVRIRNTSQSIEFLLRKSLSDIRTAVILAGGPEEKLRLGGTLKPLIKIKGKTIIEHAIENLRKHKFSDIYIVGRKPVLSEIFNCIGDGSASDVSIQYVEEKSEKPVTRSDTARTLKTLKGKIRKTFLCVYCDVLFDYNLSEALNFHLREGGVATLILKTEQSPVKWGVVNLDGNKITSFEEKPKKSDSYIVFSGIFFAEPELLKYSENSLEYELFPFLAKKSLLAGLICSGKSQHVHEMRDR